MHPYSTSAMNAYDEDPQARHARGPSYFEPLPMDRSQANAHNYGYVPLPVPASAHGSGASSSLTGLSQGLGAMSIQAGVSMPSPVMSAGGTSLPSGRMNLGPGQFQNGLPVLLVNNGGLVYAAPAHTYRPPSLLASPALSSPSFGGFDPSFGTYSQYGDGAAFNPPYHPLSVVAPPARNTHSALSETLPSEVPSFSDRKSSLGSNNGREASSSPDTPYLPASTHADRSVVIARDDHHVAAADFGYRTPSPHALLQHHFDQALMLNPLAVHAPVVGKEAAAVGYRTIIPQAITAVFENRVSRKSLEASLHNPNGTTNVYIRGFPPETNDAMLHSYAVSFGRVVTSKAMIDQQSGACKGFGFACYQSFAEAENCIRGFYALGYDVSFARESFNARLKALSDPTSTNLYVSNLPRSMNESELAAVFAGYTVESTRIQRDENGNSKGVGFARFPTRKDCDEVIAKFNGQLLGQERLPFQVRYADTAEQKRFKAITQERRDYKSGEYNTAAFRAASGSGYSISPIFAGQTFALPSTAMSRRGASTAASYTSLDGTPLQANQVMLANVSTVEAGKGAEEAARAELVKTASMAGVDDAAKAAEVASRSPVIVDGVTASPTGASSAYPA